jgi:CelD/BcsL family acetyltransferase involved in cellulose biosynthesis
MSQIVVNVCAPESVRGEAWADLVRRAPENVFMHPAALRAAQETGFADIVVLTAWAGESLVGLWGLQRTRQIPLAPSFLAAPAYEYAFASMPVIDAGYTAEVVDALLSAIASRPGLPRVLRLKYFDGDCAAWPALRQALAERNGRLLTLAESERPFASRSFGRKQSGSTRKKLRQDWNRLGGLGAVDLRNEREPGAVRAAFEVFLAMEAASWKGSRGTALLSEPADAAFARRIVGELAADGSASVALLCLDGRPIAAQVLLYSGRTAYTWKTAFDADLRKYSPGVLLIDRVTDELLNSGTVEAIESCSPEGGFMNQLWTGRRPTVNFLVDVGGRSSPAFLLAVAGERGYATLRAWRNRLRAGLQRRPVSAPPAA